MSRADAIAIFHAGVDAVKPAHFIPQHIKMQKDKIIIASNIIERSAIDRLFVVAVGKAASAMAFETEKIIGAAINSGIVVTKYHHSIPLKICRTIEAGHPVPDKNSVAGGKAIVDLFKRAGANDVIIMLVSGGASALLTDYPPGCALEDVQKAIQELLKCGAAIDEINTIRKHLSLIKGGKLVQYTSATIIALLVSDVPGNDLSVIASGLTVPDKSTFGEALQIVDRYQLINNLPKKIIDWLKSGTDKEVPQTATTSKHFDKVYNTIVADNNVALEAARTKAVSLGYDTSIISPGMTGEASRQAKYFITAMKNGSSDRPTCLLWGGETTVTIQGTGKGGRNQEFALAALCNLKIAQWSDKKDFAILSAGTDGTDGPTDAAGAVIDENSVIDLQLEEAQKYLHNNDAYPFFAQTGDLLITGPTYTNVMDIVIGLINPKDGSEN